MLSRQSSHGRLQGHDMEGEREECQKQHGQPNRRITLAQGVPRRAEDMNRQGSGEMLNRQSSHGRLQGKCRSTSSERFKPS